MKVKVAAIQMSADIGGREANVERAERLLIHDLQRGQQHKVQLRRL